MAKDKLPKPAKEMFPKKAKFQVLLDDDELDKDIKDSVRAKLHALEAEAEAPARALQKKQTTEQGSRGERCSCKRASSSNLDAAGKPG